MHEVLVNRLGGLSLPRKSVVRLNDRPDMTLDVYRGRKTTIQHCLMLETSSSVQFCLKNLVETRLSYYMYIYNSATLYSLNFIRYMCPEEVTSTLGQ